MLTVLKILGRLGLFLTFIPSVLFLMGMIELDRVKLIMIFGTVLWLGAAPVVQKLKKEIPVGAEK